MNRAVFLDRDGTMCPDVPYLEDCDRLELFPGVARAIRRLRDAGFKVIVVTNQSGVGRGYFTLEALTAVHTRLRNLLRETGTDYDALYYCPHAPDEKCACRKPLTGMIDRAVKDLSISLEGSYIVGDDSVDIELGRNAGLKSILVLTGHGRNSKSSVKPDAVVENLEKAADLILKGVSSDG